MTSVLMLSRSSFCLSRRFILKLETHVTTDLAPEEAITLGVASEIIIVVSSEILNRIFRRKCVYISRMLVSEAIREIPVRGNF